MLSPDLVFKMAHTFIFDKSVFSVKLIAAPQNLYFHMHGFAAPYKTVAHKITTLVLPENPHAPGAANDSGEDDEDDDSADN